MNKNSVFKINKNEKINNYTNLIKFVENQYLFNNIFKFNVGDIIHMEYNTSLEKEKNRIETYEGLIISKAHKNFTLRRNIKGSIIEHTFPINSPRILSIIKKKMLKINKSKLFFINKFNEKKIKSI